MSGNGKKPTVGPARGQGPWDPSAGDLAIYADKCRGTMTLVEIGIKYGVSKDVVWKRCKRIDAWLWPQRVEEIREIKARHEGYLFHIFRESIRAWERSRRAKRKTVIRTVPDGKGKAETVKTVELTSGDPRHLANAMKALNDIREIWGANAPLAIQHVGEPRVAGRNREDVIREKIAQMQKALEPHSN